MAEDGDVGTADGDNSVRGDVADSPVVLDVIVGDFTEDMLLSLIHI